MDVARLCCECSDRMRFLRQRMVGDDNATLALTIRTLDHRSEITLKTAVHASRTAAVKSSPENLQASEAALHLFQCRVIIARPTKLAGGDHSYPTSARTFPRNTQYDQLE